MAGSFTSTVSTKKNKQRGMASLTCATAPGVVFASREELHEHYKTEWVRRNHNGANLSRGAPCNPRAHARAHARTRTPNRHKLTRVAAPVQPPSPGGGTGAD